MRHGNLSHERRSYEKYLILVEIKARAVERDAVIHGGKVADRRVKATYAYGIDTYAPVGERKEMVINDRDLANAKVKSTVCGHRK